MINTAYNPRFRSFQRSEKQQFKKEITKLKQEPNNTKLKAAIGATAATLIPLGLMMKKGNVKNPLKLEYGLKDMLALSAASVAGGTMGGMIGYNKESKIKKIKEGTFQFLNAALPTLGAAFGLKACAKQSTFDSIPCKILSVALGVALGMFSALKISNFIFDPKDKYPDRKLSLKDCLASADEAVGALALAKFPLIRTIQVDKALPLIYGYCGYRAGKTE